MLPEMSADGKLRSAAVSAGTCGIRVCRRKPRPGPRPQQSSRVLTCKCAWLVYGTEKKKVASETSLEPITDRGHGGAYSRGVGDQAGSSKP